MGVQLSGMEQRWHFQLLGEFTVQYGNRVVTRFPTQKTGALLAYLAYHLPRAHPRDVLTELLWPDSPPHAARQSLSQALSSLRHLLEPLGRSPGALIVADRATVRLNADAVSTDTSAFEKALHAAAHAACSSAKVVALTQAMQLYRSPLLPDYGEVWILAERERLAECYFRAMATLIRYMERAGEREHVLEYARQGVRLDPLREGAHRELMRLLASAGEPTAALRQYRRLEQLLGQELGDRPSRATRSLAAEIERQALAEDPSFVPPVDASPAAEPDRRSRRNHAGAARQKKPSTGARPSSSDNPQLLAGSLRLPCTRFFGREDEIRHLCELLARSPGRRQRGEPPRLVTLTGPGGSGKTRLALEVAARLAEARREAVCSVSLADLAAAWRIPDAIRDALGLPRLPNVDTLAQVAQALTKTPSLLLLDNFEHLVDEGAPVVRALLDQVPSLICLVTSRRRLGLTDEQEFFVPPLPTPGSAMSAEQLRGYASVQLFVERARAVRPDFQLTAGNAAAVAALCERLEGFPLSIELAAARSQVLSPAQMLKHLERRFDFLVSRHRDAASRHRTLRDALEWSYRLLAPELQRFFRQLCVFRGGWTLEAAEAVCEELLALDYLEQLRECSLVLAEAQGDETRVRMLETLREYAGEQLTPEERSALERRHMAYYLALAEQADPELLGVDQHVWLKRLERERDNFRAALAWAIARGEAELGLRLGGALGRFWSIRSDWAEGRQHLAGLLALPGALGRTSARAKGLFQAGSLALQQGDYAIAHAQLEQSVAIWRELGDPPGLAAALRTLGHVVRHQGDYKTARSFYEESLGIERELRDPHGIALVLFNLGAVAQCERDYETACALYQETLVLRQGMGDKHGIAAALYNLGLVAHEQGDTLAARVLYEDSLSLRRELEDKHCIATSLYGLGELARSEGHYATARVLHGESLSLRYALGEKRSIAECLEGLGKVARMQGQPERAARLLGAAQAIRAAIGTPLAPGNRTEYEREMAALRSALGEETFTRAWAEGHKLTLEAAVAFATEEALGEVQPANPGRRVDAHREADGSQQSSCPPDLADAQWQAIEPLIPPAAPGGRPREIDLRAVINAILYRLHTRCAWRQLPPGSPPWSTVRHYFRRWQRDGTWQQIHQTLNSTFS